MIEDDKGGDEIGVVRRFCYLGNWIRQRLAGHSDEAHSLTYAGISQRLVWPHTMFRHVFAVGCCGREICRAMTL